MDNARLELQKSMMRQRTIIERPFLMLFSEPLLGADISIDTKITRVRDETTDDN
jgi:ABC-type Na+ transport system ATPase subunit NatA